MKPILVAVSSHATAVQDPVETYLAELSRALLGPRRRKADLMAEARDSLVDATEAFEAEGLSQREAAERAVADFGDLAEVVPGYRSELGIAQGRRTALLLFLVMIAQPIVWLENTWSWTQHPDSESGIVPIMNQFVQAIGTLAMVGSVLVLIATGLGLRYPPVRERATKLSAQFALSSCVLVGCVGLTLATMSTIAEGSGAEEMFVVSGFLLLPLSLVSRSAHRCLQLA